MARSRAKKRRFALVPDHEQRDGHQAIVARRALGDGEAAHLLPRQQSGIPLPPAVPTSDPTPTPTGNPVNIPDSTISIIPVTCAIVGTLVFCALLFFFWYRKQRRKATVNKRNTWFDPAKFSNKAPLSIEAAASTPATADKPAVTAYPPRKVSSTPRTAPRSGGPPAPSPLRNQADLANKNSTDPSKPSASSTSTTAASPASPASPGPTPSEKTASNAAGQESGSTPPVAATNRFSFLRDVSKMQDFRAKEPPRVQPMKRSASLLSSRMSTRRKPQRQDTAPAGPADSDQAVVPSLRITDADSPLEDSKPAAHPLQGKLVTVMDPYDATMPDELSVVPGETLRVIEAYDDDWCLAERVGRKKGRGILPQICVAEKGSVRANMRFSMLMREE